MDEHGRAWSSMVASGVYRDGPADVASDNRCKVVIAVAFMVSTFMVDAGHFFARL